LRGTKKRDHIPLARGRLVAQTGTGAWLIFFCTMADRDKSVPKDFAGIFRASIHRPSMYFAGGVTTLLYGYLAFYYVASEKGTTIGILAAIAVAATSLAVQGNRVKEFSV
jgi:hypothetical protein